jgi:hypothetical protein
MGGLLAEATPQAPAIVRALRWALAALLALAVAAGFAAMLVMIVVEFERAISAPQLGYFAGEERSPALTDGTMP